METILNVRHQVARPTQRWTLLKSALGQAPKAQGVEEVNVLQLDAAKGAPVILTRAPQVSHLPMVHGRGRIVEACDLRLNQNGPLRSGDSRACNQRL